MANNDYVETYDEDGNIRHQLTTTPNFESTGKWTVNADGELVPEDGEPISVEQLSNIHILDPDASDWGAAVNSKLTEMTAGDVLLVPPVEFNHDTKASISKQITIISLAALSRASGNQMHPVISKTSDVPILESDNVDVGIRGLNISGLGEATGTTDGIIVHGNAMVRDVVGTDLGGDVLVMEDRGTDNLNGAQARNISGKNCAGDVVNIVDNSGADSSNLNNIWVEVNGSSVSGWAVNIASSATVGRAIVNFTEGSSKGINCGGNRWRVTLYRHEGSGTAGEGVNLTSNSNYNVGEMVYDAVAAGLTNNGSNNRTYYQGGGAEIFDGNKNTTHRNRFVVDKPNGGILRTVPTDLTAVAPTSDEVAFHDGSGTPSDSLCFETGGNWYNIVDGTTF